MKQSIVSDGSFNLGCSKGTQDKLCALRESIQARYATELASASVFRRFAIWLRIEKEFRRERKKLLPSPQSLYHSGILSGVRS
jgi:hypothetical protein